MDKTSSSATEDPRLIKASRELMNTVIQIDRMGRLRCRDTWVMLGQAMHDDVNKDAEQTCLHHCHPGSPLSRAKDQS